MQWKDEEAFGFPDTELATSQASSPRLFSQSENTDLTGPERSIDMLTAQLRTRYYYTRYILYRPYIFKALHHPKMMSQDDDDLCADALYSMCLWPALLEPPKLKKRLIPHLYAWTQNYFGMLLIFHAVRNNDYTRQICNERVGEERIQDTVALMLDWMRDAKQLDGTAEWGWKIVEPLFSGDVAMD